MKSSQVSGLTALGQRRSLVHLRGPHDAGLLPARQFEDARRSMRRLLTFAEKFRMDNPLTKMRERRLPAQAADNLTYDAFGPPAAFMRGLFEYLYRANGLTLVPHIPPSVTELAQLDPVRFGGRKSSCPSSAAEASPLSR